MCCALSCGDGLRRQIWILLELSKFDDSNLTIQSPLMYIYNANIKYQERYRGASDLEYWHIGSFERPYVQRRWAITILFTFFA